MKRPSPGGLLLALALLLTACDERDDAPPSAATPTPGTGKSVTHLSNQGGWVGPFGDHAHPSPATLAESRQLDDIRHALDDGLYDRAREQLKVMLENGCQHPDAFFLQATLLYRQGNFDGAAVWCDRAIGASPYWIDPRVMLAQSYIRLKRLAAAENVFGDLDRLAPTLPWGPYGTGVLALMRGDQARATTLLDEALRRDPNHLPSLRVRCDLAAQTRNAELEERLIARYVSLDPDSAWAYVRLGELASGANRLDDARRAFLHAYDLDPQSATARRLAELAQRRDDPADARHWQEKAGTLSAPPPPNP